MIGANVQCSILANKEKKFKDVGIFSFFKIKKFTPSRASTLEDSNLLFYQWNFCLIYLYLNNLFQIPGNIPNPGSSSKVKAKENLDDKKVSIKLKKNSQVLHDSINCLIYGYFTIVGNTTRFNDIKCFNQ